MGREVDEWYLNIGIFRNRKCKIVINVRDCIICCFDFYNIGINNGFFCSICYYVCNIFFLCYSYNGV